MKTRTSEKTVTCRKPFALAGLDEVLPAGIYSVETEEELVEGISYPAYRRTATVLRIHAASGPAHLTRSEEHTSELQSLMRISYAVFCLKKTKKTTNTRKLRTKTITNHPKN